MFCPLERVYFLFLTRRALAAILDANEILLVVFCFSCCPPFSPLWNPLSPLWNPLKSAFRPNALPCRLRPKRKEHDYSDSLLRRLLLSWWCQFVLCVSNVRSVLLKCCMRHAFPSWGWRDRVWLLQWDPPSQSYWDPASQSYYHHLPFFDLLVSTLLPLDFLCALLSVVLRLLGVASPSSMTRKIATIPNHI